MGCCESKKQVISGLSQSNILEVKNIPPKKPLKLTDYTYSELNRELDFQVVCITKPELSYILKIDNTQLETWTLYNLEVQIIEDLKDHMIESFRFSQMNDIQKSFYNQKMIQFMDLLPIYIELSVDDSMEFIQIEIPHSNHVINIPYDNNATIKYIKKKISEQVQLQSFELVHQGEMLRIDDMSLQDCKINPSSKIVVQEITNASIPLPLSVTINNKRTTSTYKEMPSMIKRMGTLDVSQDLTINNITKIQTKVVDEDQTQEILDNLEAVSTKSQDFYNHEQKLKLENGLYQQTSSKSPIALKKGSSKHEKQTELLEPQTKSYKDLEVGVGFNILLECRESTCNQYQIKQMVQLNLGEFFINSADQELLVQCLTCQKPAQINELLFYNCSYIVSGIYKMINQEQSSLNSLNKQNDCQYKNTKEHTVESYDFNAEERDWKSIRVRARHQKKNKVWCCFCTRAINQQKDNFIQLTCTHSYHENCIQKLKKLDSTCVMCVF